tara:strand:- start:764 stop:1594 length:831 start_codon:yes stop_codon:yes gene_type:complete
MSIKKYVSTTRNQEKPFKFLLSKILMKLKISHFFSFKHQHHHLKFYPSMLSRMLWVDSARGHNGTDAENFTWNYLKTNDVFIDIGANIGTVTLEASKKIGTDGKIFSFEPNPKIFEFLNGNIKHNDCKNIEIFNIALGENSSEIFFSDNYADTGNSIQHEKNGVSVKMKKLDEIIPPKLKINLMKIDVVGYEKFTLLGATNTLQNIDCIHFPARVNLNKKYDYDYKDVFDFLRNQGFSIYKITTEKKIELLPENVYPKDGDYIAAKNFKDFSERIN